MKLTTTLGIALLAGAGIVASGCDRDVSHRQSESMSDQPLARDATPSTTPAPTPTPEPMATEPTLPQSTDITQSTNQPADVSQQARMFEVLDQDRDGFVSKLEAKDHIDHYSKADSNSDGRLDRSEFAVIELKDIESKTIP